MSSVVAARHHVQQLGSILAPDQPVKVKLDRLYRRLSKVLPDLTRRRVRALYDGEARRIDYDEMRAIEEAIASEEVRRVHQEFSTSTARLAAIFAAQGTSLSGADLAVLRRIAERAEDLQGDRRARSGQGSGDVDLPGARL